MMRIIFDQLLLSWVLVHYCRSRLERTVMSWHRKEPLSRIGSGTVSEYYYSKVRYKYLIEG